MVRTMTGRARTGTRGVTALLAALSLGLALAVAPTASAAAGPGAHQPEIRASGEPGALPGDRYLGDYYAKLYGTPVSGWTNCFPVGPRAVLKLPTSLDPAPCTIRKGQPVFIEGFAAAISNLEDPFSSDSAVQLQTARDFNYAVVRTLLVSIDGAAPVDLHATRFEVVTDQRTVFIPEGNGLDAPPQVVTLTAHGWMATIRGLTAGTHHIVQTNTLDFGAGPEEFVIDSEIDVTPGGD
jgi:hypothetical protein